MYDNPSKIAKERLRETNSLLQCIKSEMQKKVNLCIFADVNVNVNVDDDSTMVFCIFIQTKSMNFRPILSVGNLTTLNYIKNKQNWFTFYAM